MSTKITDNQMYIEALKNRDPLVCQEIYNTFLPKIISMIKSRGGTIEQAKEVFQNSILAILLDLKTRDIVLKSTFQAYLKGVCFNKFMDMCRKEKKELRNEDNLRLVSETDNGEEIASKTIVNEARHNLISECFEKLGEDCKTIINGKLNGLKTKDIMKSIGFTKPENAFYQKRFDCMRRLRKLIEQHPKYKTIK